MKINLDFIPTELHIVFCKDHYKGLMDDHGVINDFSSHGVTTVLEKDNFHYIVACVDMWAMHDQEYKADNMQGVLIHELSHVVSEIFLRHGFNCDELRSYLLQHLYLKSSPILTEFFDKLK